MFGLGFFSCCSGLLDLLNPNSSARMNYGCGCSWLLRVVAYIFGL